MNRFTNGAKKVNSIATMYARAVNLDASAYGGGVPRTKSCKGVLESVISEPASKLKPNFGEVHAVKPSSFSQTVRSDTV